MSPFIDQVVITRHEMRVMVASNKKADVLFAINVLSYNFFDNVGD